MEKTIVYKQFSEGFITTCKHCGKQMLLPEMVDKCPECETEQRLLWVDGKNAKAVAAKTLHNVEFKDVTLKPYQYLTAESLQKLFPNVFEELMENEEIRCCKVCGKPMTEGYYANDEYYCSDECLYKDFTKREVEEMMYQLAEDENLDDLDEEEKNYRFYEQDVCYYTEWESAYNML